MFSVIGSYGGSGGSRIVTAMIQVSCYLILYQYVVISICCNIVIETLEY